MAPPKSKKAFHKPKPKQDASDPAQLLDVLMGKDRNLTEHEKETLEKPRWDDESVCEYMLAGTCPFNVFSAPHHWRIGAKSRCTETCNKVHDKALQKDFQEGAEPARIARVEKQLLGLLQSIVDECDREVEITKVRVAETEQSVDFLPNIKKSKEKLSDANENLRMFIEQAEAAAECGCVDLAQESMHEVERLVNERSRLEELLREEEEHYRERYATQRVCTICGSVTNPNDETTEARHMHGNRHNGWAEVRQVLSELREKYGAEVAKSAAAAENERKSSAGTAHEAHDANGTSEQQHRDVNGNSSHNRSSSRRDKHESSRERSRKRSRSHHHHGDKDRDKDREKRRKRSRSRSRNKRDHHHWHHDA